MSFGGGDSPSNTQYATQFSREAPEIEASKLGLMGTARDLTRFGTNPWELSNKDSINILVMMEDILKTLNLMI